MTDGSPGTVGPPALRALAERMGVQMEYTPVGTHQPIRTSDETSAVLLGAMGLDVSSDHTVQRVVQQLESERDGRWLEAARVLVHQGEAPASLDLAIPVEAN